MPRWPAAAAVLCCYKPWFPRPYVRGRAVMPGSQRKRPALSATVALAVLLALAALRPAAAQQLDVSAQQNRINAHFASGNYQAAFSEAQALEALVRARLGTDNPTYMMALTNVGAAHQRLGRYREAERIYAQVGEAYRKHVAPTDIARAQPLGNLATVYRLQGRNREAETLYKQALDIRVKASGGVNAEVVKLMGNIADVYANQARHAEAEAQYKQALALAEQVG